MAVAEGIPKRLLGDPVDGQRRILREPGAPVAQLQPDPSLGGPFPDVGPEGRLEPHVFKLGRPKPPGNPAYPVHHLVKLFPELFQGAAQVRFLHGLLQDPQAEDHGRQPLGRVVVELPGDAPALLLRRPDRIGPEGPEPAPLGQIPNHRDHQILAAFPEGAQGDLHGDPGPVLPDARQLQADPHGPGTGIPGIGLPMSLVIPPDLGGHQGLHLDPDQFPGTMAEQALGFPVGFHHPPLTIHQKDPVGGVHEDGPVGIPFPVGSFPTFRSGTSRLPLRARNVELFSVALHAREPPMIRTLLQVPLSAKLLLANGVLLAAAAGVGAWMGRAGSPTGEPAALVVLSVIVLGMFGINWILVRIALAPVKRLEEAAVRVSGGDPDVQVPASPVADRSLRRLTGTFNEMVHSLGRLHRERDRLSQDLLAAGEQERKALAQELLSGPAQTLSTTLLLLRRNGSGGGDGAQAAESVRGALEELRRISAALHPPELNELGLATALRALTRSRLESREIQTQVKVEGTETGVPEKIRLGAFRLIQEAVEIAARMPRLDRVSLWLRKDGPSLLIHVSLAGLPPNLSPEALPAERESGLGSGLHRMVERARLMGGDVRIQGGPGPELAILVRLPVAEAPASFELPRSGSPS